MRRCGTPLGFVAGRGRGVCVDQGSRCAATLRYGLKALWALGDIATCAWTASYHDGLTRDEDHLLCANGTPDHSEGLARSAYPGMRCPAILVKEEP